MQVRYNRLLTSLMSAWYQRNTYLVTMVTRFIIYNGTLSIEDGEIRINDGKRLQTRMIVIAVALLMLIMGVFYMLMYISGTDKSSFMLPVLSIGLSLSGLLVFVNQLRTTIRQKISIHEVRRVVILTGRFSYLYADIYLNSGRRRRVMLDLNDTLRFGEDHLDDLRRTFNDKNIPLTKGEDKIRD
ncbi:MAG TPA: hypothetical protein VK213_05365 [Bacteroidales bacterium]|nr:hypothetical protein [Bacteroidales bacterium]